MVAGLEKYFQIARCFRDEDLRAARQPEFTQIDIEATFVNRGDIYELTEQLVVRLFGEAGISVSTPFRRMPYSEAMESCASDRPDLRYDLRVRDVTSVFERIDFGVTKSAIARGERIRGLVVPDGAGLSRKQVDDIEGEAKAAGAA